MKQTIYIMLLSACLLAMGACSSEDIASQKEESRDAKVRLTAAISSSKASTRAKENLIPDCIKKTFSQNDEIRFVNTVFFSNPTFDNTTIFKATGKYDATKGYEFTQSGTSSETQDTESDTGADSNALTWNDFRPTSFVYTFEAAYDPQGQYNNKIPSAQTNEDNFLNADLLLASHRMPIEQRNEDIELIFRHALAMVRIDITMPISLGLQKDAIQEAVLQGMQTQYEVDYKSSIDGGQLRHVEGTGKTTTITMYQLNTTVSNEKTQDYTFVAIIPVPGEDINQDDFVRFKIKVNNTDTWYGFKRNEGQNTIKLEQSKITHLKLTLNSEGGTPLLISAEVKDWSNAYTEVTLEEDKETTVEQPEEEQ